MTQELITQIALDDLHESPFNPRKTFSSVDELAQNILAEGRIHQPLLVRPRLTNPLRDDVNDGWEIVFGHRRYRAAERAGLATVPCMVRAMSSAEARRAQIAENLARTDVHPIEEAEGFAAMMEQDGLSADDLVVIVGKSRSYVYGRLKLLQACPEVRQACLEGKIGSEVALLIARLRTAKLQAKALADIRSTGSSQLSDGGKQSFRKIRDMLNEKFTLALQSAPFDRTDATLVPDAGTCTDCPKRSGNAPEFADVVQGTPDWRGEGAYPGHLAHEGEDVCTDPDCFAAKKAAQFARHAEALRAEGKTVIEGTKARAAVGVHGDVKGAYVALKDVKAALKKAKGTPMPATVTIQDPRNGKLYEAVKREDLPKGDATADLFDKAAPKRAGGRQDWEAERKAREAKAEAETAANMRLLASVRQAARARPRSAEELRIVLAHVLEEAGYSDDCDLMARLLGREHLHCVDWATLLQPMGADDLALLLLDVALVHGVNCTGYRNDDGPVPLTAMATLYGIDIKAASAAPPEPASTPSPAGASAEEAATAPAAPPRGVKYMDPMTMQTWTGRGLRPAWINAAIAGGKSLSDFEVKTEVKKVKVDAGCAGEHAKAGMFEEAGV
jgi:ParB/RepB/Spo0J family partition protein